MLARWFRPNHSGWNPHAFEWYFGTSLGRAIRAREERAVFDLLGTVMEPRHSVLEVGCGTGNYTLPVARRCARTVAVDSSAEMLGYVRERLDQGGLTRVETLRASLPEGLGALGMFDGVLAVGVLNYVENLDESLRAIASALRPGGWAIFNVPVSTWEGRIYELQELFGRRRINLLSPEEAIARTESAGLRVRTTIPAGLSRGGLTLVVGSGAPDEPPATSIE